VRNSLIHIDGLASGGKGDSIDELNRECELTIKFASQIVMYPVGVPLSESGGWHDAQDSLAGLVLCELELSDANKGIIVHVQGSPGNLGTVGCNQDLLGTVTTNVSNDDVLTSTRLATVTHVRSPVASAVTDERHHRIDETGPHNLTPLAWGGHRVATFIKELEVTVGRPNMIVVGVFAFGCQDELLAVSVTREVPAAERFFDHPPLFKIYNLGFGDDAPNVARWTDASTVAEACECCHRGGIYVQKTWPNRSNVFQIPRHILIGQVKGTVVMVPENWVILVMESVSVGFHHSSPQYGYRHPKLIADPFPTCCEICVFDRRSICIHIEMQRRAACSSRGAIVNVIIGDTLRTHGRKVLDDDMFINRRELIHVVE